MTIILQIFRFLLRAAVAEALDSRLGTPRNEANDTMKWSDKLFGDPEQLYDPIDENVLNETPNEEDDLDDEDGQLSFDAPADKEGDASPEDFSAFNTASRDEANEQDDESMSDEQEESDEDEEDEESRQDEEDKEDIEDEQGEVNPIDLDTESESLDVDDDQDYNEEEQAIIDELTEEDQGGYDVTPDEVEEDAETLFNLLADSDMPTGEEFEELDEDGLESGPELFNETTDVQEDFLGISADDADTFLLDAALLVNDPEIYDTEFNTSWMVDMGIALTGELP